MTDDEDDDWLDVDKTDEAHDWLQLQPPPEGDFLGPIRADKKAESATTFLDVMRDDATPREVHPDIPAAVDTKMVSAILAAKRLLPRQRTFIRAMIQEGGNISQALKLFNARSPVKLDPYVPSRWMKNQDFKLVYQTAVREFLDFAGIDPAGVLLRVVKTVDDAMKPVPILHQGKHTGYYEQDRTTVMRGAEFLGKVNKMLAADDSSTRVTLNIVNLATREEMLDVSPEADTDG